MNREEQELSPVACHRLEADQTPQRRRESLFSSDSVERGPQEVSDVNLSSRKKLIAVLTKRRCECGDPARIRHLESKPTCLLP